MAEDRVNLATATVVHRAPATIATMMASVGNYVRALRAMVNAATLSTVRHVPATNAMANAANSVHALPAMVNAMMVKAVRHVPAKSEKASIGLHADLSTKVGRGSAPTKRCPSSTVAAKAGNVATSTILSLA